MLVRRFLAVPFIVVVHPGCWQLSVPYSDSRLDEVVEVVEVVLTVGLIVFAVRASTGAVLGPIGKVSSMLWYVPSLGEASPLEIPNMNCLRSSISISWQSINTVWM